MRKEISLLLVSLMLVSIIPSVSSAAGGYPNPGHNASSIGGGDMNVGDVGWLNITNGFLKVMNYINATGNIYGAVFYGSGAGLYNIPAGAIADVWVNASGDTMSGSLAMGNNDITGVNNVSSTYLTAGSAIYQNAVQVLDTVNAGTGLQGGGSGPSTTLNINSSILNGAQYDDRFVNVNGDNMSGQLNMTNNDIAAVNNITATLVTGGTVYQNGVQVVDTVNAGTGLQGGGSGPSTTLNINSSILNGAQYDDRFVNVAGDTMTGDLNGTNANFTGTIGYGSLVGGSISATTIGASSDITTTGGNVVVQNGNVLIGGGVGSGGVTLYGTGASKGDVWINGTLYVIKNITGVEVSNINLNGSMYPKLDATFDVGSSALRWRNANFSGNVQAGTYYGSGAGLTNIPASAVQDVWVNASGDTMTGRLNGTDANFTGTVYASAFSSNSPLLLQTKGTTRMYVDDTTGYVGINTTNPGFWLDVRGTPHSTGAMIAAIASANTFGGIYMGGVTGGSPDYVLGKNDSSGNLELRTQSGGRFATVTSTGNVGIGTTTPSSSWSKTLQIADANNAAISWARTGAGPINWSIYNAYDTPGSKNIFAIYNNKTGDLMTITDSGNIGIGMAGYGVVTTASKNLQINGSLSAGLTLTTAGSGGTIADGALIALGSTTLDIASNEATNSIRLITNANADVGDRGIMIMNSAGNVAISEAWGSSVPYKLSVFEKTGLTSGGYEGRGIAYFVQNMSGPGASVGDYNFIIVGNGTGSDQGLALGAMLTATRTVGYIGMTGYYPHDSHGIFLLGDGAGTGINVGIGTPSPGYKLEVNGTVLAGATPKTGFRDQGLIVTQSGGFIESIRADVSSTGPQLELQKSHGTLGSPTVVLNGDELGGITAFGWDGTDANSEAAHISFVVDGAPGFNDMPGKILFQTTRDGSSGSLPRMVIDNRGIVGIGTTTPLASGAGWGGVEISNSTPVIELTESDATANNKKWIISANNEQFLIQAMNDAENSGGGVISATRTANALNTIYIAPGGGTVDMSIATAVKIPASATAGTAGKAVCTDGTKIWIRTDSGSC